MVLPFTADLQITAGKPLLPESALDQKIFRPLVRRKTSRLDAVQAKRLENERQNGADRVLHIPLTRESFPNPVPQGAALRDPPAHVGYRAAAQQRVVALPENKKGVGRVVSRLTGIAFQPAAKSALGQLVSRPLGFPGREEGAALAAQLGPLHIIGHAWIAQV